ncbi:putative NRPS-like protein biosynthetic cluster [Pestalotiopsis sp. IQ-011]
MIPGPTLSDELFGSTEDVEALTSRKRDSPTAQVFWEHVRQKEFVLWPVQSDAGIWSTIILHLGMSKDADFDTVTDFAVVDASSAEKEARVVSRLGQLLDSGDMDFHLAQQQHIWVPPQADEDSWESGIRCFELIRQLVSRLTDGFCNNQSFEWDQAFGPPTRGWLNVDFIRHEMMGMALERCNTILNYSCRYALEPIMDIRLEDGINLAPDCLAQTAVKHAYIPGTDIAIENGQNDGAYDQEETQNDLKLTTADFENSPDHDQIRTGEPEVFCSKRPSDSASITLSEADSVIKRVKTE